MAGKNLIYNSAFANGMFSDFKFDLKPTPAAIYGHLPDALDKPLHKMTEGELHGLVDELRDSAWQRREQQVAQMTQQAVEYWRGRRGSYAAQVHAIPPSVATYSTGAYPMMQTFLSDTVTVSLPEWLDESLAYAFAERMIREQLEGIEE